MWFQWSLRHLCLDLSQAPKSQQQSIVSFFSPSFYQVLQYPLCYYHHYLYLSSQLVFLSLVLLSSYHPPHFIYLLTDLAM